MTIMARVVTTTMMIYCMGTAVSGVMFPFSTCLEEAPGAVHTNTPPPPS